LYVAYSMYAGKKANDNINHDAHLWGGLYGMLFVLIASPQIAMNFIDQLKDVLP